MAATGYLTALLIKIGGVASIGLIRPLMNNSINKAKVAFKIYDMDKDGFISNGELFQVLKMMVGTNLTDTQLQQIVDKTIFFADKDGDGKINFEEFCAVVGSLDVHKKMVIDV